MEAYRIAELLPSQSQSSSSSSTERTYLPIKGSCAEFSCSSTHRNSMLRSDSSSSPQTRRKLLPRMAFSNHRLLVSPPYSSSFLSSTQQATCKDLLRRLISDCQAQKFSTPPPSAIPNRKRLPGSYADFQVQGYPSSPSTRHVRRKHLPRAFSDLQVSSSSPSLTTHNVKRKHLPRAFIDYSRLSSFSSTQHVSKTFSNYHTDLGYKLAEQQQPLSLSVRTAASVGGLSVGIHGRNLKKGRQRKHTHQGSSQDLENTHEKEISGVYDSHNYDDVPYDKDSNGYMYCDGLPCDTDGHVFCDNVPFDKDYDYMHCKDLLSTNETSNSNFTGSQVLETYIYDSIHGAFWKSDPYYQEFERLQNETARQEQALDGSTPDIRMNICTFSEPNPVERLDIGNSQNYENTMAIQGGNGAVLAYESLDISEFRAETVTEGSPSLFKETYRFVKEPLMGTLEKQQNGSLDSEKHLPQQDEHSKHIVREDRGGEGPLANVGSVQNIEGTFSEFRHCSDNNKVDGTGLECRSPTEAAVNAEAYVDNARLKKESGALVTEVVAFANATLPAVEKVGHVADLISDSIKEQVVNVVEKLPAQVTLVSEQVMSKVVNEVAEVLPDPVVEHVGQVAEQVTQTEDQIVEQVASEVVEPICTTASQIVSLLLSDEDDEMSDDEFEAYTSLDIPEFKGWQGLNNFTILQEQGIISLVYDFYIFILKRSPFEFTLGMFVAPILVSVIFTTLYLPEFNGLALDETVRQFMQTHGMNAEEGLLGLQLSWETVFQVFMFSLSLSTGLQPELAPLSPYTLVVANLNALVAQLVFVFLSGAVFARLSQPSQPVKCSTIAIICPHPSSRGLRKEPCHKALLTRYVLVGPQPCELVDVKVDLTYAHNTITRSGTFFRTSQSLKLVRPEIAFLDKGMLVRHTIDETSPLYQRTQGMLEKEDAVFSLHVVGLERSSMQSVFHVQHYCVYDKDVVWDAEFIDMIVINRRNRRVIDHSLLSKWRPVAPI